MPNTTCVCCPRPPFICLALQSAAVQFFGYRVHAQNDNECMWHVAIVPPLAVLPPQRPCKQLTRVVQIGCNRILQTVPVMFKYHTQTPTQGQHKAYGQTALPNLQTQLPLGGKGCTRMMQHLAHHATSFTVAMLCQDSCINDAVSCCACLRCSTK